MREHSRLSVVPGVLSNPCRLNRTFVDISTSRASSYQKPISLVSKQPPSFT